MKKISWIFLLCFTMLLTACSSKDDMLEYVPADANLVVKVNTKSIMEKSGFKMDGSKWLPSDDLTSLLASIQVPSDVLQHSGIDFEKNIAVFGMSKNFSFALLAPLSNSDDFKNLIEKDNKEIGTKNGIEYTVRAGIVYAFNDDVALICVPAAKITPENTLKNIVTILSKDGKSIKDNPDAMKAFEKDNDLISYFNYENFWKSNQLSQMPEFMNNPIVALMQSAVKGLYKYQVNTIDFEKDNIKMVSTSYPNKENDALKACQTIFAPIKNNEFLKFFPSDVNVMMAFSTDGKKIVSTPQFGALYQQISVMPGNLSSTIKEAMSTIDGTIAFGMRGDKVDADVLMSVVIKSSDPQKFISLMSNISPLLLGSVHQQGDLYILERPGFYMKYGVKDGYFFASTSKKQITVNAYSNEKLKGVFNGAVFSIYGTSGPMNSYVATSLREACGFDLLGEFWSKASTFEKSESQLTITKPVGNNIIPIMIKIINGVKTTRLKNQSAVDDQLDDPYSYTPGQPLGDIYKN